MSLVTRGLSAPNALLATFGLGQSVVVSVIVPIEQVQEARETLVSAGILELDLTTSVVENLNQTVGVIEFIVTGSINETEIQIEIVETALTIAAVEFELSTEVCETIK